MSEKLIQEPVLDAEGYPSNETIKRIVDWPYEDDELSSQVLDFALKIWWNKESLVTKNPQARAWYVSTGGWSGNETLIDSLQRSLAFRLSYLLADLGHGHYLIVHKDDEKLFDRATAAAIQIISGETWCPDCYGRNRGKKTGKTLFELVLCSSCSKKEEMS